VGFKRGGGSGCGQFHFADVVWFKAMAALTAPASARPDRRGKSVRGGERTRGRGRRRRTRLRLRYRWRRCPRVGGRARWNVPALWMLVSNRVDGGEVRTGIWMYSSLAGVSEEPVCVPLRFPAVSKKEAPDFSWRLILRGFCRQSRQSNRQSATS
jgi:hypothetical protein